MKKTIIFGIGGKLEYAKKYEQELYSELDIIAFSDNKESLWGEEYDGIPVISPENIIKLNFDRLIILSKYYKDIAEQLIDLGINENKIFHWDEFKANKNVVNETYFLDSYNKKCEKKILIITDVIGMNGGSIAGITAGKALTKAGYNVTICSSECSKEMIETINSNCISVIIAPYIQYPTKSNVQWVKEYEYILINTFQMMRSVCVISSIKPVIWWLHESSEKYSDIYNTTMSINYRYSLDDYPNIKVCPVSLHAAEVFNDHFPEIKTNLLPIAVEDLCCESKRNNKLVIAVIGAIIPLKNQMLAVNTVKKMENIVNLELIGETSKSFSDYADNIRDSISASENINMIGGLTPKEMQKHYKAVNIVLCTSLEECLPTTIIEGMMNKKICITSDTTGIADYMTDGVDGFIFKSGDIEDLKNKLEFVVNNWDKLDNVREAARKTYEKNFTLEKFGERIGELLGEE